MTSRVLTHEQARAFYDRFARAQDLQRFYENPALEALMRHGAFERAGRVIEFGCGTGAFAAGLLAERLPATASYVGLDVSPVMVELARQRVAPWAERAEIRLTDGAPVLPLSNASCDRVVSTYVFDLLSDQDMRALLREARRVLAPGGLLCLASLTWGKTRPSRAICRLWNALHALNPKLVGGCRPIDLLALAADDWRPLHHEVVCAFGICTEVLIAG